MPAERHITQTNCFILMYSHICGHRVANADLDQKEMDTPYVSQNFIIQTSRLFFLKLTPEHCFVKIDAKNLIGSNSPRKYKMKTCKADFPKHSFHVSSRGRNRAVKKHSYNRPKPEAFRSLGNANNNVTKQMDLCKVHVLYG